MALADTPDYAQFRAAFDVAQLDKEFVGSFEEGINACVECCDRYAGEGRTALYFEGADGSTRSVTFDELKSSSAQFANLLQAQGIGPGDCVAALLPRVPELLTVILGTFRAGAVYQALFTAFGPKAIQQRIHGSGAKLIVTDSDNRPKLNDVEACPPIVVSGHDVGPDDIDFAATLERQSDTFAPVMRHGDELSMMLFTSGTTGAPKGVGVPLSALRANLMYMRYGLDLRPEDRFWNIADPGWAYGLYHGVVGPLLMGQANLFQETPFTVDETCDNILKHGITNLAGAPTAYRMMIAAGDKVPARLRGKLRVASSAGEPLNPEVVRWFAEQLDCPVKDQYGQTEIAMMLMNHHGLAHSERTGSAGLALPGFTLAVVNKEGERVSVGKEGILAVVRSQSPLFFFPGYSGREGQDWVGDYYLTGDMVEQGQDGAFSFVGRSDDVITSAGYRIGPFDVESSLLEHPAVLESAVVGKPDEARGHIVKAFVVLVEGYKSNDELSEELRLHVRARLGAHAYPREITFVEHLPKTPSGKIQRFLLREQA